MLVPYPSTSVQDGHKLSQGRADNGKQELSVTCPLGMPAGPGPRTAPATGAEYLRILNTWFQAQPG